MGVEDLALKSCHPLYREMMEEEEPEVDEGYIADMRREMIEDDNLGETL